MLVDGLGVALPEFPVPRDRNHHPVEFIDCVVRPFADLNEFEFSGLRHLLYLADDFRPLPGTLAV